MILILAMAAALAADDPDRETDRLLHASPNSARLAERYYRCFRNAKPETYEWTDCGTALVAAEEALLARTWARLDGAVQGGGKAELAEEQRVWAAYKDKSCLHLANQDFAGWLGRAVSFPLCRSAVIAGRIKALEDLEAELKRESE